VGRRKASVREEKVHQTVGRRNATDRKEKMHHIGHLIILKAESQRRKA
jgi:hypothetical protein